MAEIIGISSSRGASNSWDGSSADAPLRDPISIWHEPPTRASTAPPEEWQKFDWNGHPLIRAWSLISLMILVFIGGIMFFRELAALVDGRLEGSWGDLILIAAAVSLLMLIGMIAAIRRNAVPPVTDSEWRDHLNNMEKRRKNG